jgi:hypothetical protein
MDALPARQAPVGVRVLADHLIARAAGVAVARGALVTDDDGEQTGVEGRVVGGGQVEPDEVGHRGQHGGSVVGGWPCSVGDRASTRPAHTGDDNAAAIVRMDRF